MRNPAAARGGQQYENFVASAIRNRPQVVGCIGVGAAPVLKVMEVVEVVIVAMTERMQDQLSATDAQEQQSRWRPEPA